MSLFKVYRGTKEVLPKTLHDGYAYFCADTGEFFIDVDLSSDGSGLKRVQVNALAATQLSDGTTTVDIDDIVLTTDPVVKYDNSDGATLTLNAVLVGNGTDTVKIIPANLGAFFVDVANGEPKFGVLPVGQGGIGASTLEDGGILKGNGTNAVSAVSGVGVLYSATKGAPQFGIAPLTVGGTGSNSAAGARSNLDVYSKKEVDDTLASATTVSYTHTLVVNSWLANPDGGFVSTWTESKLQCGKNHDVPPEITFTSNRDEYNKITSAVAESGIGIKFYIDNKPSEDISIIIIDQM